MGGMISFIEIGQKIQLTYFSLYFEIKVPFVQESCFKHGFCRVLDEKNWLMAKVGETKRVPGNLSHPESSRLVFFYEIDWSTWLRWWALSQAETIVTLVFTCCIFKTILADVLIKLYHQKLYFPFLKIFYPNQNREVLLYQLL